MGFSKKHQSDSESIEGNKKWMIAGIALRAPLKPISTKISIRNDEEGEGEDDEIRSSGGGSTTPVSNQSRIPAVLPCPPPPRKRRPASTCHNNNGGNREFFTSPDIDSLFKMISNTGRAN